MTILHGQSVTLRPWARSDLRSLVAHANDRRVWANLRDRFPHPYGEAEAEAWLAFVATHPEPALQLAIAVGDEAIGGIGLERFEDVHRGTAEIGYWLGTAHWARGYATDAVRAMTAYGFDTVGLDRIQATVFEWNAASERVLVKAGYRHEGRLRRHVRKDGELGDAALYATVREDHERRSP